MNKIKISIAGCLGRMGQQVIKSSQKSKDFKIISLTENKLIKKKNIKYKTPIKLS